MHKQMLLSLYEYNDLANEALLRAAAHLPAAQFAQKFAHSFESVQRTFVHMIGAEWLWFVRWRGESPGAWHPEPKTLGEIRTRWTALAAERNQQFAALGDD
ncbi:MAG: hypothetical protein LC737_08735, partial [Chloroflexi bacterium]|nr:hypothetical protein [Chloroflexota bacterium]